MREGILLEKIIHFKEVVEYEISRFKTAIPVT